MSNRSIKINKTHKKALFLEIDKRSDRAMAFTLIGNFLFGLFLATYYETWLIGITVGSLNLAAYWGSKLLLPNTKIYQYVGSTVLGIFMAQFIFQMHGLFEMHFFAFISSTLLISYSNWRLQLPLFIVIIIHHITFAYLQFLGVEGVYFTQLSYMDLDTFLFHLGLALVIILHCGFWGYFSEQKILEDGLRTQKAERSLKMNLSIAEEIKAGNFDTQISSTTNDPLTLALQDMRSHLSSSIQASEALKDQLQKSNDTLAHQTSMLKSSESVLQAQKGRLLEVNEKLESQKNALEIQNQEIETAQVQLIVNAEELEESNRYKSEFMANMSHEIRTPMNAILGLTHLLKDAFIETEERESLDLIQRSSLNLLNIINDILDLSKIESGMFRLEKIDYQPLEVVDLVFKLLETKTSEKGIKLLKKVAKDLPQFVIGDPHRLNQILVNLLGNAIKFTERGSVTLQLSHTLLSQGDLQLDFKIIDTGIGIPKDKLDTIFESFSQAEEGTSRKFGGTGLGLTISRKLVEIHGGKLSVESQFGQGSTFSFSMLCQASTKVLNQDNPTQNQSPFSLTGLTDYQVLLVDDNKVNRLVGKKTLSRWKMKVDIAVDGKDAVEQSMAKKYDLILMDLQMPIMNGYEASKVIREDTNNPNCLIPIIALTANVMDNVLKDAKNAGINTVVTKPFDPGNLYRVMESYITPSAVRSR